MGPHQAGNVEGILWPPDPPHPNPVLILTLLCCYCLTLLLSISGFFFFFFKNHILLELEKFLCHHFPPGFTDAVQGLLGGKNRTGACVPPEFCASDRAPKPASWPQPVAGEAHGPLGTSQACRWSGKNSVHPPTLLSPALPGFYSSPAHPAPFPAEFYSIS